ncbi:MAG TPA: hypothetical protein VHT27_11305 [Solirubrobacteraceae bacterium]|nr:hypothetical protein [Solirubrobacteraceae bacterium]
MPPPLATSQGEAVAILVGFALIVFALVAAWRWLDRKGAPRRRTVSAFVLVLVLLLIVYPKLVT